MAPRTQTRTSSTRSTRGRTQRGRTTRSPRSPRSPRASRTQRSGSSRSGRTGRASGSSRGNSNRANRGMRTSTSNRNVDLDLRQVDELLLQALETERGGIQVYETALRCAQDGGLRKEWTKYLDQTREHERILIEVFQDRGLDTEQESPGRGVVRHIGQSLVQAMEQALQSGDPEGAQLVACECVVFAETKDHQNWELIGEVGKAMGQEGAALRSAADEVEDQEDEHLYHTMGWCRELWLQSLGFEAALPPPEEERDVDSAIGQARAKKARKRYIDA